jgi:hypothetical protein
MEKENQLRIVTSQREDWPLSFNCPEVWELKKTPMRKGVKFFLRGPLNQAETLFASVTVRARPSEEHTLSQLAHEWIERRSAFRTFRLLARTETDLAGGDAIQLDAAHDMPLPLGSPQAQMITVRERVVFALRPVLVHLVPSTCPAGTGQVLGHALSPELSTKYRAVQDKCAVQDKWNERIYELCYRATGDAFEKSLPAFEALVLSLSLEG